MTRFAVLVCVACTACDWAGFEPRDRELVACWPNCGPDAAVLADAEVADSGVSDNGVVETQDDASEVVDLGVDGGIEEPPDVGIPDAGLNLLQLRAELATPNTITFAWDAARIPANAEGYVLRYSPTLSEVQAGGGVVWDHEDDGNLGFRSSPHGPGVVSRTTILGLDPNMVYAARLYAIIPAQGPMPVAEGTGHTTVVPEGALTIFAEALSGEVVRDGFLDPETAARAHDGLRALWLEGGEVEVVGALSNLGLLMPGIDEVRFASAYLEMFVYIDFAAAPVPTYYMQTGIDGPNGAFSYTYTALPSRDGWIQVQLAVAGFEAEAGGPMTATGLGEVLSIFGISAVWPRSALVYVDDVVFRY